MSMRDACFGATPGVMPVVTWADPPVERLLAALVLGGQGRYAAASALLGDLLRRRTTPAGIAAHAAVALASHRRQLGGHAAARPLDALGLRLAGAAPVGLVGPTPAGPIGPTPAAIRGPGRRPGTDADGTDRWAARIDALVGLAADALGTGAPDLAARLLDAVGPEVRRHGSWRPAVRAGWVRAELALAGGQAGDATGPAADALVGAEAAGAVRHVVKSRTVLAVARGAAGAGVAVVPELDAAAAQAGRHGLLPLVWPALLAAADLLDGRTAGPAGAKDSGTAWRSVPDHRFEATRRRYAAGLVLSEIARRSDPVGRRLMGESLWLPRELPLV